VFALEAAATTGRTHNMGGIPRLIELKVDELTKMAEQGLSINQSARAYKCKSDSYVRTFLVNHPELLQKFMQNGKKRQVTTNKK
jgi:hypothetical protein